MELAKKLGKAARTLVFLIFFDGTIECLSLLQNIVLDQDLACLHLLLVRRGPFELFLLLIIIYSYGRTGALGSLRSDQL